MVVRSKYFLQWTQAASVRIVSTQNALADLAIRNKDRFGGPFLYGVNTICILYPRLFSIEF